MKDYKNMTDLELNVLVIKKTYSIDFERSYVINYCNDYQCAMQLLVNNKISLRTVLASENWEASNSHLFVRRDGSSIDTSSVNSNPCRAIVECYLKTQEAKEIVKEKI